MELKFSNGCHGKKRGWYLINLSETQWVAAKKRGYLEEISNQPFSSELRAREIHQNIKDDVSHAETASI